MAVASRTRLRDVIRHAIYRDQSLAGRIQVVLIEKSVVSSVGEGYAVVV